MKPKARIAYADFGSHGGIFRFDAGPVADRYPGLLQVYDKPAPGLVPVKITPIAKAKSRQQKG